MIPISDFIRKGDKGEMKKKLKFPDTPWHIEYTKKAEDEAVMIPYDEKLTNEKIAQIVWKHIRKSK